MKMGGWVVGAALLLSGAPLVAADKNAPVVLEPSSPWNVHYADDFCRLARDFGAGDAKITLIIDRYEPGDDFRLSLAGEPMKRGAVRGEAKIRFGAALPEQSIPYFPGKIGKDLPAWIFAGSIRVRPLPDAVIAAIEARGTSIGIPIPPMTEHDMASVTAIYIGRPLRHPVQLATGPMKAAFGAMNSCTEELLTHWGIDVARHRDLSRPATPLGSPGSWLDSSDYPSDMLQKGQPGIVHFRLTVAENGRATVCHIQQSTDREGFDATVCKKLMSRARFEPALAKDGKPLVSYYLGTVQFQIP